MTRLSFAQAREFGIDERIIREAEQHVAQAERSNLVWSKPGDAELKPKRAKPADGYDSKLERDFADMLVIAKSRELIKEWWHHPCGLRLAPHTYYHVDFMVEVPNPEWPGRPPAMWMVEVKGGWFRDDAKVKTKVAAEKFPCFRWLIVYREKRNGWDVREVDHRGIGMSPIHVPWICNL